MRDNKQPIPSSRNRGFTLIELMVFIVVVGLALGSLVLVFNQSVVNSVDPTIRVQMIELAQSQLDEVMARKYDEATPTGGIPACDSAEPGAVACIGIGLDSGENLNAEATLDDVDDFNGYSDTPYPGYARQVSVQFSGSHLGLGSQVAKRISVTVSAPGNQQLTLTAYRSNF